MEDVKPSGFKRLIHFIYNSRCLSWKIEDPEEWWFILEAANKYMNMRLVDQVERRLRDIAKRDAGEELQSLSISNSVLGFTEGQPSHILYIWNVCEGSQLGWLEFSQ